jgi:hypothetical protein
MPAKAANELEQDPRETTLFAGITGVNTSGNRTDIGQTFAYNLENIVPVGPGNLTPVPNLSGVLHNFASTPYAAEPVNYGGTEYIVVFCVDGSVWLWAIIAKTATQINSGTLLSGAGSQMVPWPISTPPVILFIDSTGYYAYNGTTFTKITGTGVPSSGDTIEIIWQRVFISQGRTLYCSGAGDYCAPSWLPANGAGFLVLTDPLIRGTKLYRMRAAQGALYLYHQTGVNIIPSANVPLGLVPPTPQLQDYNVEAVRGSDQPASVVPFDMYDVYASRSGAYQMYGFSPIQLSTNIADTWKYIDWTQPVSAGQFVLYGANWAAFSFKRLNDPNFGSNWIVGCVSSDLNGSPQWWFLNGGSINLVTTGWVNGTPTLFGFSGTALYQFCSDTTTAPRIVVQTALTPADNPIRTKSTLKCGFQGDFYSIGSSGNFSLTLDNENTSTAVALQLPTTITGNFQRYFPNGDAPNVGNARYVGFTLIATGWNLRPRFFALDYKLRESWGLK